MKKIKIVLLGLMLLMFTGCGTEAASTTQQEELNENAIMLYRVNTAKTDLVDTALELENPEDTEKSVEEMLGYFMEADEEAGCQASIPGYYKLNAYTVEDNKQLTMYFSVTYPEWGGDKALEVLCKGAWVKSFCQLEGINKVSLVLESTSVSNETSTYIENYDAESFVLTNPNESGYSQSGSITIYFANEAGDQLKEYHKAVEITNNVSLEQVVMESLITGPLQDGYTATIPEGTELIKVSVKDGIAYVNLNSAFNGSQENIRSDLAVYSVVNSLIELPTINKVQFLIEGEKQELYRETIPFDGLFERNLEIVESENPVIPSEESSETQEPGLEVK